MKLKKSLSVALAILMVLTTLSGLVVLPAAAEEETAEESVKVPHSYISNGLYAWYSGDQNTREGQDTESAVWEDLISGKDMTINRDDNNYFTADGLHVKSVKHYFPEDVVAVVNGESFTVEIEFGDFTSIGDAYNTVMNSSNDNFALFRRNDKDVIEWKFGGGQIRPQAPDGLNNLNNHVLTVTYEYGESVVIYVDGVEMVRAECPLLMGADDLFIGHDDTVHRDFETTYKNIRFYTRALSAAEIRHNAAVDGHADIRELYVQEGLVSLYSGVSNTEAGFDASATVWADLVGENDLPITVNANNYFNAEGLRVTGADTVPHKFPQPIVDLVNGDEFTVEILFGDFVSVGTSYNTFMNSTNDAFSLYRQVGNDSIFFKFASNAGPERPVVGDGLNSLDNGLITATYKVGGKCCIYIDGVLAAEVPCNKVMGATDLFIGQREAVKTFDSTYKSIRFYNRELTAAEVKANANADGVGVKGGTAMDNPGFVTVEQPVTHIIGDVAMVRPVNSQTELETMMNSKSLPASALLTINKDLEVLDANGKAFSTVADVLTATQFRVLNCYRISDKETADALAAFLKSIRFTDVQLMSADKEVLKYAREQMPTSYGILDMSAAFTDTADLSEEQLLEIRRTVKANNAYVVALPVGLCRNEDVQYLFDRQVNVWAWGSDKPDDTEKYFALLSGATGIVSDATIAYLDIACNKLVENTMTRVPINIGHRGIPSRAPENCIEGAQYAYELGADVIEIDVYLTKDNQAVLMHDGTTGRTCNENLTIATSTLAELTALYCNKGFENNPRFKDAKIPSLDDFLAAFKGTDVRFYIEIKTGGDTIAQIVKDLVEKNEMYGQCSVITFGSDVMDSFRRIYPEMSVGGLCMAYMNGENSDSDFRAAMQFIGKHNATLNPCYSVGGAVYDEKDLRAAMIRGVQIHPWTFAGQVSSYEKHFMWGYAGLTGDNADVLKSTVRKVSLPEEITLIANEATALEQTFTTYNRKTKQSDDITVTVVSGDAVASGNTLTPNGAWKVSFITSSTHKIGSSTYTLYTQPIEVAAVGDSVETETQDTETTETLPVESDTVGGETTAVTDESTNGAQTTSDGTTSGGCKSVVGGVTLLVLSLGAAAVLVRKKKED